MRGRFFIGKRVAVRPRSSAHRLAVELPLFGAIPAWRSAARMRFATAALGLAVIVGAARPASSALRAEQASSVPLMLVFDGASGEYANDRFAVYAARGDTGGRIRISERMPLHAHLDRTLSSSPDGKKLLIADTERNLIRSVRRSWQGTYRSKAWTQDGRWVAYTEGFEGNLFVVDTASGRRRVIAQVAPYVEPAWRPDGLRIAAGYENDKTFAAGISVYERATGRVRLRVAVPESGLEQIEWSPDGRTIAFITEAYERPRRATLWVVDAKSGARRAIAPRLDVRAVEWGPDSRRLVISARRDYEHPAQLFIVRRAEGRLQSLARSIAGEELTSPAWAPDGQTIAYLRGRTPGEEAPADVELVTPDGNHRTPVTADLLDGLAYTQPRWVTRRLSGHAIEVERPQTPRPSVGRDIGRVSTVYAGDGLAAATSEPCGRIFIWLPPSRSVRRFPTACSRFGWGGVDSVAASGRDVAWIFGIHDRELILTCLIRTTLGDQSPWLHEHLACSDRIHSVPAEVVARDDRELSDLHAGEGWFAYIDSDSCAPIACDQNQKFEHRLVVRRNEMSQVVAQQVTRIYDADRDLLLVRQEDGHAALASRTAINRRLPLQLPADARAVIDQGKIILLAGATLKFYTLDSGAAQGAFTLPDLKVSAPDILDVSHRVVAYRAGATLRVRCVGAKHDALLGALGMMDVPMHAAFDRRGLVYAYQRSRTTARIVFLEWPALRRTLRAARAC